MSIYIRSHVDEDDGIVINYAVYHSIYSNFMKTHTIHDLINSRSNETREEFYKLCEPKAIKHLSYTSWSVLPEDTRPTTSRY